MAAAGRLIWISLRPIIRLALTTLCGFGLTKADLFPAIAARGAGQIILNITIPSLFFSRIVTSISTHNATAIGPLVIIALLYEALGFLLSTGIKQFFWVPHRFRWGIVVAGVWANWGDIPNAVVTSITLTAPFNGPSDSDLAVAYLSVILLIFSITLFPLGGHNMIAWDFHGPDVEDKDVREAMASNNIVKRIQHLISTFSKRAFWIQRSIKERDIEVPEGLSLEKVGSNEPVMDVEASLPLRRDESQHLSRHVSFSPTNAYSEPVDLLQHVTSPTQTITSTAIEHFQPELSPRSENHKAFSNTRSQTKTRRRQVKRYLQDFTTELVTPRCLSIVIGLVIALVPVLKALFTPVSSVHIPNAPDGQPPLAFVLDTTQFIGNASVPLGLICLGSALARMRVPSGNWRDLPLGAIASLAIGKMIVMPILGVLICQGLAHVGFIDPNDRVLRFVCILISATPTATTQVYMTQVYSGTGSAEHLSPFLLPQYAIMVFSTTALIAFTVNLLY